MIKKGKNKKRGVESVKYSSFYTCYLIYSGSSPWLNWIHFKILFDLDQTSQSTNDGCPNI